MNDLQSRIIDQFEQSARLKMELADLLAKPILQSAELIVQALLSEKKVLTCGNGGGSANAQYFASRMLNHFQMERPGLAAIALSADNITLTAIANQGHFEQVFSKQVLALGMPGDVLIAFSTSGNSKNVNKAIAAAKEREMHVIALSGGDGGNVVELLHAEDIHIGVPHDNLARIQEVYVLVLHCLCDAIDCILLGAH